jgi:uncharacterized membrane protein YcaP (DUF421 family)
MHELLDTLFGFEVDSHTISALQIAVRSVLVFFAALALLRLSGQRTFGGNTAFDMVIKIMLGAVLSRAVVAASPFGGTLLAGLVLVGLHRLLAWASFRSETVSRWVKGDAVLLAEHGQPRPETLAQHNLTHNDLLEGLRDSGNVASLADTEAVRLERNGSISVVKKRE